MLVFDYAIVFGLCKISSILEFHPRYITLILYQFNWECCLYMLTKITVSWTGKRFFRFRFRFNAYMWTPMYTYNSFGNRALVFESHCLVVTQAKHCIVFCVSMAKSQSNLYWNRCVQRASIAVNILHDIINNDLSCDTVRQTIWFMCC